MKKLRVDWNNSMPFGDGIHYENYGVVKKKNLPQVGERVLLTDGEEPDIDLVGIVVHVRPAWEKGKWVVSCKYHDEEILEQDIL